MHIEGNDHSLSNEAKLENNMAKFENSLEGWKMRKGEQVIKFIKKGSKCMLCWLSATQRMDLLGVSVEASTDTQRDNDGSGDGGFKPFDAEL